MLFKYEEVRHSTIANINKAKGRWKCYLDCLISQSRSSHLRRTSLSRRFFISVLNTLRKSFQTIECHVFFFQDSGKPRDIYLLDFQSVRYASPATDLSHNFFISCGHDLRSNHFEDLVKIYHDSLSAYLSELGSDPKKLFPFEALEDQLKKFSAYGAAIALRFLPIYTSQGDDVETHYTNDTILRLRERIKTDHHWRNIYRDAFKDLIDRDYI